MSTQTGLLTISPARAGKWKWEGYANTTEMIDRERVPWTPQLLLQLSRTCFPELGSHDMAVIIMNPSCGLASLNVFLVFKISKVPTKGRSRNKSAFCILSSLEELLSRKHYERHSTQPPAAGFLSSRHALHYQLQRFCIARLQGEPNHCRESQKRWFKSALCHSFLCQSGHYPLTGVCFLLCEVGNTSMRPPGSLCLNDQEWRIRKSYA